MRSRSFLLPFCLCCPLLEEDTLELALELALEEGGLDDCLELATLPVLEEILRPIRPSELVLLRGDTPVHAWARRETVYETCPSEVSS